MNEIEKTLLSFYRSETENGKTFVCYTIDEVAETLGFTRKEIQNSRNALKRLGFIRVEYVKDYCWRTYYINQE